MTAQRLTNSIKDQIEYKLLDYKFKDQIVKLNKEYSDFAREIYNDIYDAKTRKIMESLPFGWLHKKEEFSVQFLGKWANLNFNKIYFSHIHKPSSQNTTNYTRLFLASHTKGCLKNYDVSCVFTEKWDNLEDTRENLKNTINKTTLEIRAALNSVTTVNKLINIWPEIEPFVPKIKSFNVPALPVEKLNILLNLPKEKTC